MTTYPSPDHWLTAQAATVPEAAALREQMDAMRLICQSATDTLGTIDDWLGMASTRESAMDSIWRLSRLLMQNGFDYKWRNALDWRGAGMKELNDAGFFKNSTDGFFHYDPMADKEKPYRIYGNSQGPTLKEFVVEREQSYAAGARDGQLAERQANEATVAELRAELERHKKFVAAYDNRYSKDKDSFVRVLEAREELDSESVSQ